MKRILLATLLLISNAAYAQQKPADAPEYATCKQLLNRATMETLDVVKELSAKLDAANAEIAKLKEPAK